MSKKSKRAGKPNSCGRTETERFSSDVREELGKGFSFTPFVGAGVSAASGLMMGRDFMSYLVYALYRCVAPDSRWVDEPSLGQELTRWNIPRDGWLRNPTGPQSKQAEAWLKARFRELLNSIGNESLIPLRPCFDRGNNLTESEREEEELKTETLQRFGGEESVWESQIASACRRWERAIDSNGERNRKRAILEENWLRVGVRGTEFVALEKALRSLYDWKAILAFLSHLSLEEVEVSREDNSKKAFPDSLVFREYGDKTIIDRFNLHISWGQKPNLAHNQIVHLARPLRIRQILTTNFDTLIEQAFAEVEIPIRVIETTTGGNLPDPALVLGANSLVKLHGGTQQTRADFSLNEAAAQEDKDRFVRYLHHHREIGETECCSHNPSHLLLLGFSGEDWRVIDLIQETLWKLPNLKVYCLANSSRSAETFEVRFAGWEDRVSIYNVGRADLVLLRLYQELTHTLPPGGFSSRFGQPVPAGIHPPADDAKVAGAIISHVQLAKPSKRFLPLEIDTDGLGRSVTRGVNRWQDISRPSFKRTGGGGWIVTAQGGSGLMKYSQALFEQHTSARRDQTIWMELEDHANPDALIAEMLRILALNRGRYQTSHVDLDRHPSPTHPRLLSRWVDRVLDYLDLSPNDCALFLYGRNGPGGCSRLQARYWRGHDYGRLETLLDVLASLGFMVYYMPFSKTRWDRNREKEGTSQKRIGVQSRIDSVSKGASQRVQQHDQFRKKLWPTNSPNMAEGYIQKLPKSVIHENYGVARRASTARTKSTTKQPKRFESMLDNVAQRFLLNKKGASNSRAWRELQRRVCGAGFDRSIKGRPDSLWKRLRFLYACSLFRQSRHPSALISEGVFACPCSFSSGDHDNDLVRAGVSEKWLKILRDEELFYDKPGGYLWQYRDTRLGIQALLESLSKIRVGPDRTFDFIGQTRARLHFWIGDWYRDAFLSTRHILPMIESIYHRCAGVHFARWAKPGHLTLGRDNDEILRHRAHIIVSSLTEIADLLELGYPSAAFWQPGEQGREVFSNESIIGAMGHGNWDPENRNSPANKEWISNLLGSPDDDAENLELYSETVEQLISRTLIASKSLAGRLNMEVSPGFNAILRPSISTESSLLPEGLSTKLLHRPDFCSEDGKDKPIEDIRAILEDCLGKSVVPNWVFDTGEIDEERSGREHQVAQARYQIAPKVMEDSAYGYIAIQAFAELAYVRIKSNKLASRAEQIKRPGAMLLTPREGLPWVSVTMICSLGIALLRVCHTATMTERMIFKQKFLAFYGLSLGFLGRFHEAHRRINQATALTHHLPKSRASRASIILRIRRAEIHLAEATHLALINRENLEALDQSRRITAKIDDAVVSLEAAEHLLQGRSHSSLWWGRFYSLRLRAIALSGEVRNILAGESNQLLSLAFRRRHDYLASIRDIFSRAELLCHNDDYRLIRTIDYTLNAVRAVLLMLGRNPESEKKGIYLTTLNSQNPRLYKEILSSWHRLSTQATTKPRAWRPEMETYYMHLNNHWGLDMHLQTVDDN